MTEFNHDVKNNKTVVLGFLLKLKIRGDMTEPASELVKAILAR